MQEPRESDQSFTIERIWETPPPSLTLDHLHVPHDLRGKKVLELFSGKEGESMKQVIESRGGTHITVDTIQRIRGGKHAVADAFSDLPFKKNAFDRVLMAGPPMYGSHEKISIAMVDRFLRTSLRVLKEEPGSFIGVLTPLSHDNVIRLCDDLKRKPEIVDNYFVMFERTNTPLTDLQGRIIPGEFVYTIRVNRI